MSIESDDLPGWNIFARELASLLAKRKLRLGHLNDRAGIHPQKVSRLQRSLREPKFSVLSPTDLEKVQRAFTFSYEEMLRLRAAILATAIEEILMSRINLQDAYIAAQQIFPTLLQAVGKGASYPSGMGAIKGIAPVLDIITEDARLEDLLDQLDVALLHLYLASGVSPDRQLRHATIAQGILLALIQRFEPTQNDADKVIEWSSWRVECTEALDVANSYIDQNDVK